MRVKGTFHSNNHVVKVVSLKHKLVGKSGIYVIINLHMALLCSVDK